MESPPDLDSSLVSAAPIRTLASVPTLSIAPSLSSPPSLLSSPSRQFANFPSCQFLRHSFALACRRGKFLARGGRSRLSDREVERRSGLRLSLVRTTINDLLGLNQMNARNELSPTFAGTYLLQFVVFGEFSYAIICFLVRLLEAISS